MKISIRNIIVGLKNIWRWRKVIFKDRDCDYWYTYEILKTKLKFQADYIRKYSYHESAQDSINQILDCVDLIDKVQNDYYIEQALDGLDVYGWTDVMFDEAIKRQDAAKKLLFSTLEANMESWWS